jgi:multiple sugar transport system permease protein
MTSEPMPTFRVPATPTADGAPTAAPLGAVATRNPTRRPRHRSTSTASPVLTGLSYALLTVSCLAILTPFGLALVTSLRSNDDFITSTSIWPGEWSLDNFVAVFTEIPMGQMIFNGLFIAVLATAGNLLSSTIAAFALAKLRFPGRSGLFGIVLFTMLIPGAVTLIPLYTIIRAFGLVDSLWALILPMWTGSAFAVFLLRQHMMSVPNELYEAAVLDGCSTPGVIFRIFLPLVRGPLAILAILNFIASWNDLLGPLVYLNSPEKMTPTVGLTYFQGQYLTNFPVVLAGALVILVPTTIVFVIFNRQLRQGMLISGIK